MLGEMQELAASEAARTRHERRRHLRNEHGVVFRIVLCLPMGTKTAILSNGDFGTSPFFGSDQARTGCL